MRHHLLVGAAVAALAIPAAAYAQSTGSAEAEGDIIVTGSAQPKAIDGIRTPDSPKARAILTQEIIERRTPGQTVLDTINLVPGVNFTNSDAYGSSGGNIRIRGFDGNRISLTEDGIPLNDSGNYAIYSNQQLDPELVEQINVNFGATDVDAPTASASGGTINYRSIIPSEKMGATAIYSHGTSNMNRAFILLQSGNLTSSGTRAWLSASEQRYNLFRGPGEIYKQQYNGKIYQPLGNAGDFISVTAHYNQNRNSFYSNPSLSNIRGTLGSSVVPSTINTSSPYTLGLSDSQWSTLFNNTSSSYMYSTNCAVPSATGGAGKQDDTSGLSYNCYLFSRNPSNTGNIRLNSRFTLSDRLTLTIDGAYQYVKANGGGSTVFAESDAAAGGSNQYNYQYNRVGAGIAAGYDINHDGDLNDLVRVYFPSNTRTQRFTVIAGLRYELDQDNAIRLAYSWDRARHRQTGEASYLQSTGMPYYYFGTDGGEHAVTDAAGNVINKRNRLSYAILHQVSAEYRGNFFDDQLKVALGVRAPFFRRNLNNYCWTISGSSNDAYCTSQTTAQVEALATAKGLTLAPPYTHRIKTYSAVLPNVGLTFNFTPEISAFASYAKGFSAPRTDNLYSFDDKVIAPTNEVKPEKTDSIDLGLRYTSRMIQAQLAGWYIHYDNRIISSVVELEGGGTINIDRNVGATETKGIDASLGIQPIKYVSLYGFLSYIDSELKQDAINPVTGAVLAATKGKFVVETPKWQYGGRIQANLDPFSAGLQVKHVGDRYVTDVNDLVSKGYTVVDLDARVNLGFAGLDQTYFQLNVTNLLNERYFGNLSTGTTASSTTRFTFGAPRSIVGTVHFQF